MLYSPFSLPPSLRPPARPCHPGTTPYRPEPKSKPKSKPKPKPKPKPKRHAGGQSAPLSNTGAKGGGVKGRLDTINPYHGDFLSSPTPWLRGFSCGRSRDNSSNEYEDSESVERRQAVGGSTRLVLISFISWRIVIKEVPRPTQANAGATCT
jgi:hypothetical protein